MSNNLNKSHNIINSNVEHNLKYDLKYDLKYYKYSFKSFALEKYYYVPYVATGGDMVTLRFKKSLNKFILDELDKFQTVIGYKIIHIFDVGVKIYTNSNDSDNTNSDDTTETNDSLSTKSVETLDSSDTLPTKISYDNLDTTITWKWSTIKDQFQHHMKDFFDFRFNLVNKLIQKIFNEYPLCYAEIDPTINICKSLASGSIGPDSNLFSDYDLTITGHFQVSKMIQLFNGAIFKIFNMTPFEAFDTNLYGYSFMIPINDSPFCRINWSLDPISKKYNVLNVNKTKSYGQDIWAYRRLLSLCIEASHYSNINNIEFMNIEQNDWIKMPEHNLELMTSTEKSNNYMRQMENFEKIADPTNETIPTVDELINSLSNMNYFGDETYFTQGAFVHVVGTMFYYKNETIANKLLLLSPKQLIHSMIENLAYFIYSIKKTNEIIIASKYLERFLNAYMLLSIINNPDIPISPDLRVILNEVSHTKQNVRNLSNVEIHDKFITKWEHSKSAISLIKSTPIHEFANFIRYSTKNKLTILFNNYLNKQKDIYFERFTGYVANHSTNHSTNNLTNHPTRHPNKLILPPIRETPNLDTQQEPKIPLSTYQTALSSSNMFTNGLLFLLHTSILNNQETTNIRCEPNENMSIYSFSINESE